jgi:hypothetical protein
MTTNVPSQYQTYVQAAASYTGLPESVVAAQINEESGFNPNAVSPTGAQGIAQFEPGTWSSWGSGSPFNVADAFNAYERYMKYLINLEGGNVQDALAAYNAGPGNTSAGMGYADTILSNAGEGYNITAGSGTGITTDSSLLPSWLQGILSLTPGGQAANSLGEALDPSNWVDWAERGALMIFGAILIIIGVIRLTGSGGQTKINLNTPVSGKPETKNNGDEEVGVSSRVMNAAPAAEEAGEAAAIAA